MIKSKDDSASDYKFGDLDITTIEAKSLLSPAKGFIRAYDFTLNPYRGCQYGCSYCYAAAFSPNLKMREDWGKWVLVKQNAAKVLHQELERWQRKKSHPCHIYMSTVTDPYQPIESKWLLTRRLLEVMIPFQPVLVLQTRSPMIIRDLDLICQFKHIRVNMSIPTASETVRKDFEPKTPSIKARLQAISNIKHRSQARCSITITPLLPIFPYDQLKFIDQLQMVDRVVIQGLHTSQAKSLAASTRSEAMELKKKYAWWYENEVTNYEGFKHLLTLNLAEVKEGQVGFTYE